MDILKRTGKASLAYVHSPALPECETLPALMFMGGYRSDMNGTKAIYLEDQAKARGQEFLRFDYSGHGQSAGVFEDGSILEWMHDAIDMFGAVLDKPVILVGSSMGGWIGLLLAKARAEYVRGFVGIAAAPDFTEEIYDALSVHQQEILQREGRIEVPNDYSDIPYAYTRKMYEDGKKCLILKENMKVSFPVRLFQGMRDTDVPWETTIKIEAMFAGGDVEVTLIEDGDHRLSRPIDLEMIDQAIKNLSGLS